ncbi:MAG: hypothetical protein ACFFE2_11945 [Candidatus Thorarchaeota archaeon]
MSGLTGPYLALLMAIQENPLSTVSALVDKVDGSKPTVIKRLKYLRDNRYFQVKGLLDYHKMGLESVDLILETSTLKNVERLEQVATNHPYTVYRSRCFGSHNGLFLQFRTPIGTRPLIEELIKILGERDLAKNGQIFSMGEVPVISSSMKLEVWDPQTMTWRFNLDKWFSSDADLVKIEKPSGKPESTLQWLTKNDMHILQQLTLDAKRSHAAMIRAIKKNGVSITPQTFGRRLRMIDEGCIDRYRVSFDPAAFDIITNILIRGNATRKFLSKLYARMSSNPIPFESTFKVSDRELFWFVRMPPSHLSALLSNLHANLDNMTVTLIDYSKSFLYSIWPETLDETGHAWRKDHEFMIDFALKR